ncbi:PepSY domain-containing protein [Endozoicomonadaceae bacterium StTr2]
MIKKHRPPILTGCCVLLSVLCSPAFGEAESGSVKAPQPTAQVQRQPGFLRTDRLQQMLKAIEEKKPGIEINGIDIDQVDDTKTSVALIEYQIDHQHRMMTFDINNNEILDDHAFASGRETASQRLDEILHKVRLRKPGIEIISAHIEEYDKGLVTVVDYREGSERRVMEVNSITSAVLSDHVYSQPKKAELKPIRDLIKAVEAQHPNSILGRHYLRQKDGRLVRILFFTDGRKQRRQMIMDARSGEILSDRTTPWVSRSGTS